MPAAHARRRRRGEVAAGRPSLTARTAEVAARHPLVLVGTGVVLFSIGPVMVAGAGASGPVLSFWRLWIGVALLGSLTAWQLGRRRTAPPDRTGWAWSLGAGAMFGVHQLFFMIAIKRTSVLDVTLMQLLQPLFVAVLAAVFFGERPGVAFRVWSAVSIAGAVVVVLGGTSGARGDVPGIVLAVANVAFFALYFVGSKQAREHIDTVPFLFGSVASAAVVVSAYAVVSGEPVGGISRADLLVAAGIAFVPGGLGHFVTTWPLRLVAANVPPIMQLAVPFLAGGLAWLALGQPVTLVQLGGGLVTVAGVVGALRSPAGRRLAAPGVDGTVVPGD